MPNAEIRETIVTPDAGSSVVQLQISDASPLPASRETFSGNVQMHLTIRIPEYELPLLAQLQREAMKRAMEAIRTLLQNLAAEIQRQPPDHNLDPKLKS